jgi:hypothetical protein
MWCWSLLVFYYVCCMLVPALGTGGCKRRQPFTPWIAHQGLLRDFCQSIDLKMSMKHPAFWATSFLIRSEAFRLPAPSSNHPSTRCRGRVTSTLQLTSPWITLQLQVPKASSLSGRKVPGHLAQVKARGHGWTSVIHGYSRSFMYNTGQIRFIGYR